MNLIKKNILGNFFGTIWQTVMAIVFVPIYIKYLGIESWGLIGIFSFIQIIFGLLDAGLSSTLNRELARLSVVEGLEQEMRDLVRTLELIYWGMAIFVGIAVILLSPLLTEHWIKNNNLSPDTVKYALILMGMVTALQMPVGFYSGGLMGLQKQVLLNFTNSVINTLRGGGAVLILWLISPTIQAFFLWQIVVSIFNVIVLIYHLSKTLPFTGVKASFQKKLLKGIWKFAAGMSGIMILSVILTQLDKVVLSKMLSLENFGYYTLASLIAMNVSKLTSPVMTAVYPKMVQLVSLNDENGLKKIYHQNCQMIAVLVLPVTAIIILFSYNIVFIWTQNLHTTEETYQLVSVLTCGSAFYSLMVLPYTLQLSNGWTRLSINKNIIAVILMVPFLFFMTRHYGGMGAAIAWLTLNIGYVLFEIPLIHRKILKGEKWRWYLHDVITPLLASLIVASIGKMFLKNSFSQVSTVLYILFISICTFAFTAISTATTRNWLLNQFNNMRTSVIKKGKNPFF